MSDRHSAFDRVGAVAGLVAVVLLLALFTVFPTLPAPNHSLEDIVRRADENRTGLLLAAYVGALVTCALIVFGTALALRVRRSAPADDGWWVLAVAAVAASSVGLAGNGLEIMFVRAVGHGVRGDALWVGYGADHWLTTLAAVPLAVFIFAIVRGGADRVQPRWLVRLGGVVAALLLVGAASVAGGEVDGGPLGIVLLLGYVGLIVWVGGASVAILRHGALVPPARTAGLGGLQP